MSDGSTGGGRLFSQAELDELVVLPRDRVLREISARRPDTAWALVREVEDVWRGFVGILRAWVELTARYVRDGGSAPAWRGPADVPVPPEPALAAVSRALEAGEWAGRRGVVAGG